MAEDAPQPAKRHERGHFCCQCHWDEGDKSGHMKSKAFMSTDFSVAPGLQVGMTYARAPLPTAFSLALSTFKYLSILTSLRSVGHFFKGYLFERHSYRVREIFHLLTHFPNGHSDQDWARLKPGAWKFHLGFPCVW